MRVNLCFFRPRTVMLLAALALAACQQQKTDEPTREFTAGPIEFNSGPNEKPGISYSGGTLVLPVVKGNPGAAYFTLTNNGQKPTAIAAVTINGAGKAEMHETKAGSMAQLQMLPLRPGEAAKFERGGKHVMVFGIGEGVKAGGRVEMTVTFEGGDKVSIPLKVEAAGGGMAGMAGMDHGDQH